MIQRCTIVSDTASANKRAAYDQLAQFTGQLTNLLDAWDAIPMGAIERRMGHSAVQILGDLIGQQLTKELRRAKR